jgi:hypothetical protein
VDEGQIEVTYRGKPAIANTTTLPWEIRDPVHDNKLLEWRVLLAAPALGLDTLVVFVTRHDVDAWVAEMPGGLVPEELVTTLRGFFDEYGAKQALERRKQEKRNAAYRRLAREEKLPVGSEKLFALAIERGILHSLVLVNAAETQAEVVEGYRPWLPGGFLASTVHSEGEGTLYDWPYPKEVPNDEGKTEHIYGGDTQVPIAFVTMAAESHE